jgi:molybdenum cofactor cytidylyltransferase
VTRGIVGILLAAGAGRRYGAPKLTAARYAGRAIGEWSALHLVAALPDAIAVVRPESAELAAALSACGVGIVPCADAHQGMGASLSCGVRATADAAGWVVALGDMPDIDPAVISAVADAIRGGATIAAPFVGDERGHPVGFAAALADELAALGGDAGARDILRRYRDRIERIEVVDRGVLFDVDTPADLDRSPPSA